MNLQDRLILKEGIRRYRLIYQFIKNDDEDVMLEEIYKDSQNANGRRFGRIIKNNPKAFISHFNVNKRFWINELKRLKYANRYLKRIKIIYNMKGVK